MKKILNIVASLKRKDSFSIKLSDAILERLETDYPNTSVQTHNLATNPFPYFEEAHLTSFNTPEEKRTKEQQEAIKHSDKAIKELIEADIIVIGVPVYNFSIPSTLKSWIDHITRAGVTFSYADGTPKGLLVNKKVYLAIASGAVLSQGPMTIYDFTENYLRLILGFIGLNDITVFRIEGTSMPELKETAMPKALKLVNEFSF